LFQNNSHKNKIHNKINEEMIKYYDKFIIK
jgi:hypothetical protein